MREYTYMCEKCFSVVSVDIGRRVWYYEYTEKDKKRLNPSHCPHCGSSSLVPIDEEIVEDISLINQKGYYTAACCSSHVDIGNINSFYIVFSGKSNIISTTQFNELMLPSIFRVDIFDRFIVEDGITELSIIMQLRPSSICDNIEYYDTYKNDYDAFENVSYYTYNVSAWKQRHEEHLKIFHKWVTSLPKNPYL